MGPSFHAPMCHASNTIHRHKYGESVRYNGGNSAVPPPLVLSKDEEEDEEEIIPPARLEQGGGGGGSPMKVAAHMDHSSHVGTTSEDLLNGEKAAAVCVVVLVDDEKGRAHACQSCSCAARVGTTGWMNFPTPSRSSAVATSASSSSPSSSNVTCCVARVIRTTVAYCRDGDNVRPLPQEGGPSLASRLPRPREGSVVSSSAIADPLLVVVSYDPEEKREIREVSFWEARPCAKEATPSPPPPPAVCDNHNDVYPLPLEER